MRALVKKNCSLFVWNLRALHLAFRPRVILFTILLSRQVSSLLIRTTPLADVLCALLFFAR